MSEKVTRKMTMLKVPLLAGCVKGKGSMIKGLLWFLERVHDQRATMGFGEKLPKKLPTNARGTSGLPICATFYPKVEELQEDRSPRLLILREP